MYDYRVWGKEILTSLRGMTTEQLLAVHREVYADEPGSLNALVALAAIYDLQPFIEKYKYL